MSGRVVSLPWRVGDPADSADPAIRSVVTQLRALPSGPPPRPAFKAELRAQLVAVAPRLVAEGDADWADPVRSHRLGTGLRRTGLARPAAILASGLGLLALILTGAVWMSGSAVPGDTLYGLKRMNERAHLALESNDTDRGFGYLHLATRRIGEVRTLLARSNASALGREAAAGISPHTASLIRHTLNDADSSTRDGSSLVLTGAARSSSAASLEVMAAWASGQKDLIQGVVDRLEGNDLGVRATASWTLVKQAETRGSQVHQVLGMRCLTVAATDALGPNPEPCPGKAPLPSPRPARPFRRR